MDESGDNWATEFRRIVRSALVARDWHDADLARRLDWKSGRLSNYMTGSRRPDALAIMAIADVLGIDHDRLLQAAGYDLAAPGAAEVASSFAARLTALEERVERLEHAKGRSAR